MRTKHRRIVAPSQLFEPRECQDLRSSLQFKRTYARNYEINCTKVVICRHYNSVQTDTNIQIVNYKSTLWKVSAQFVDIAFRSLTTVEG